ncbi:hypothetical protein [Rubrobacter tropicus]|uniref:hypothetical protein n=1 Tax=Rubrobacter tropicus TaxID=2653851 RepID=UPI00140C4DAB|nr:hypothetical protein [Rubrobacter tropicus]
MDFKEAARVVLGEVGHPLHYGDITEIAYHKVVVSFSATLRMERKPVVSWEMAE